MRLCFILRTGLCFAELSLIALSAQAPATPDKAAPVNEPKGVPPRAAPSDYQAQAQAGSVTIAAEFTGHAVPTPAASYTTEDYVVVEAALFGPPGARVTISSEDFSLRIKGKKALTPSVPAEVVLKSLNDPSWEPPTPPEPKNKSGFGGGGNANGDNTPPLPPKMPMPLRHIMSQHVQNAALLQGERALPQAGLLFFPFHGKPESIRSLELIYSGPAGQAELKLQP
jgi:hypothetical protein